MSKVERCPDCLGQKNVMGLGMIYQPCKPCNSVGWITKKEESEVDLTESKLLDTLEKTLAIKEVKNKPARKPKGYNFNFDEIK